MSRLTVEGVQSWIGVVTSLMQLAVPLVQLVAFLKQQLAPEDVDAILRETLRSWLDAQTENDTRIAELEAQLGR